MLLSTLPPGLDAAQLIYGQRLICWENPVLFLELHKHETLFYGIQVCTLITI